MPEPNLPPLRVNLKTKIDSQDIISVPLIQETIPELPEQSRKRLIETYKLRSDTAIQLVNEPVLLKYFQELISDSRNPTKVSNLLINDLLTALNKRKIDINDCLVTINVKQMKELIDLLFQKQINLEVFRKVLGELLQSPDNGDSPSRIIKERGWSIVINENEITTKCIEVIKNNPKLVKQYKDGKVKVFKALLGILAKDTHNKFDMSVVSEKMEELLKIDK